VLPLLRLGYAVESVKNENIVIPAAIGIALVAVPTWMAIQEWDDHDRSNKVIAPDLARNYLESCAPNAILFTFGDNDTYPLWYAQEVQGLRPDVRVINYSLLGIDWYINQLRYKVNQSAPIDVIWSKEQIEGEKLNYAIVDKRVPSTIDLLDAMKNWVGTTDMGRMYNAQGEFLPLIPSNKFSLPVDLQKARASGAIGANDANPLDTLQFEINRNYLLKNDLAVLAVIATSNWDRPIYFTSPFNQLGFENFLRRDGMAYRLVPVANERVNGDWAFEKLMKEFRFGNADKPGVYFDEENRRHLNNIRNAFADVAMDMANRGKMDSAKQLLAKIDAGMLQENIPYGLVSRYNQHNETSLMLLQAAYLTGEDVLVKKISEAVRKDLNEQMAYYEAIGDKRAEGLNYEIQYALRLQGMLNQMEQFLKPANPEQPAVINNAPDSQR
jgi:hypothetical protein